MESCCHLFLCVFLSSFIVVHDCPDAGTNWRGSWDLACQSCEIRGHLSDHSSACSHHRFCSYSVAMQLRRQTGSHKRCKLRARSWTSCCFCNTQVGNAVLVSTSTKCSVCSYTLFVSGLLPAMSLTRRNCSAFKFIRSSALKYLRYLREVCQHGSFLFSRWQLERD